MEFIVIILIIVAVFYVRSRMKLNAAKKAKYDEAKRRQEENERKVQKLLAQARGLGSLTPDTERAIRYFVARTYTVNEVNPADPDSWTIEDAWTITSEEYDATVAKVVGEKGTKEYALNACGLDESQVSEVEPLHLQGYNSLDAKFHRDGRTEKYQLAWIFFTEDELHLYIGDVNIFTGGRVANSTMEFFYRDVTTFRTSVDELGNQHFSVIVPGEKIELPLGNSGIEANRLNALKALLREKKNA